jgi:hypothetical protein
MARVAEISAGAEGASSGTASTARPAIVRKKPVLPIITFSAPSSSHPGAS